ncbi:hypothetical protein D3C72_2079160 [compost metagenome]
MAVQRQQTLDAGHAFIDPMPIPRILLFRRDLQHVLQVPQHAQVVDRMDIAADQRRQLEHTRALLRKLGDQARLGMVRVQVVDDRERLA